MNEKSRVDKKVGLTFEIAFRCFGGDDIVEKMKVIAVLESFLADDHCSYFTLQQQRMRNLKLVHSQKGKAFEKLHRQIMQFKIGW